MPTAEGDPMLLEGKTAIVYGAAGSIGAAVSAAYAREGARLFLAGRTTETLDRVADQIRANGGHADVAQVDATNRSQV